MEITDNRLGCSIKGGCHPSVCDSLSTAPLSRLERSGETDLWLLLIHDVSRGKYAVVSESLSYFIPDEKIITFGLTFLI